MEIVVVVLVLVLALAGGAGLVAVRGGWSTPALPGRGGAQRLGQQARVRRRIIDVAPRTTAEPPPGEGAGGDGGAETMSAPAAGERFDSIEPLVEPESDLPADLARLRAALRSDLVGAGRAEVQEAVIAQAERLVRLEERVAAEAERLAAGIDGLGQEARVRREADEARQDAALERLRAGVLATLADRDRERGREGGGAREWLGQRRAEVAADLYARLARLEAAVAAVTNPILLPGEPYVPPDDLLPDALAWENWKDVGERAFAFADAYSAQRLFLDGATREQVAEFVTTLRGLLTQAIYPNLLPDPTPAQTAALREALVTMAVAVPRVRSLFEESHRALGPGVDGE